jgi:uncharacterized protein YdiU (UPF0061 family)
MSKRFVQKTHAPAKFGKRVPSLDAQPYETFDSIDGRHPWQTAVADGYVAYPVKQLERGKVLYFNFALAREMGLIPREHPEALTPELTAKLLETFSVQILNEYDQQAGIDPKKVKLKENKFMATRYLQLQHANKQGKTSGDGRGIWNGTFKHEGVTWDISSRGTGVTCLAPGAVEANRPLRTGATDFGYGCGLADVSELLGSAMLSEIFHHNGINTERVLTVIDLGKGCGIGVRAARNLIRPAHLFLYLKQGRVETLRQATDYLIQRQVENKEWKFSPRAKDRYRCMVRELARDFARFVSKLERDYIFAWLDWDGDNVLANAGIIDYGSIRQFGLRHDQYRYDDVTRFSTNLNEQRTKARQLVQVFAQAAYFLETGKRRSVESFEKSPAVKDYDREYERNLRRYFLHQVGFDETEASRLPASVTEELYQSFLILEKTKTKAPVKRLPDGVNRAAVFNMRAVLRELPRLVITSLEDGVENVKVEELLDIMSSSHAKKADTKLRGPLRAKIERFYRAYSASLKASGFDRARPQNLKPFAWRAEDRNRAGRITGNGAEFVVDELLKAKRRGISQQELQLALTHFIAHQSPKGSVRLQPMSLQSSAGRLYQALVNLAFEWQEDI